LSIYPIDIFDLDEKLMSDIC